MRVKLIAYRGRAAVQRRAADIHASRTGLLAQAADALLTFPVVGAAVRSARVTIRRKQTYRVPLASFLYAVAQGRFPRPTAQLEEMNFESIDPAEGAKILGDRLGANVVLVEHDSSLPLGDLDQEWTLWGDPDSYETHITNLASTALRLGKDDWSAQEKRLEGDKWVTYEVEAAETSADEKPQSKNAKTDVDPVAAPSGAAVASDGGGRGASRGAIALGGFSSDGSRDLTVLKTKPAPRPADDAPFDPWMPGLTVILGPTGWGKTRIARSLLASRPDAKVLRVAEVDPVAGDGDMVLLPADALRTLASATAGDAYLLDSLRLFLYGGGGPLMTGGMSARLAPELSLLDERMAQDDVSLVVTLNPMTLDDAAYAQLLDQVVASASRVIAARSLSDRTVAAFWRTRGRRHSSSFTLESFGTLGDQRSASRPFRDAFGVTSGISSQESGLLDLNPLIAAEELLRHSSILSLEI